VEAKPSPGADKLTRILAAVAGVLCLALIALGAFYFGRESAPAKTSSAKAPASSSGKFDYGVLNQIHDILNKEYVKPDNLDDQTLYEAAINGLLNSLSDSGTYYVDADTYKVNVNPSGTFDGIGATVSQQGQDIVIVAPIKNTPAEAAGIQAGDVVLAVDGESTKGWTTEKAVLKIRGPRGTKVTVSIRHTDGATQDYTLTRAPVNIESVSTKAPADGMQDSAGKVVSGVGYIKISEFTARTPGEMDEAIKTVASSGAKAIVLDLRGNPGGLLNATVSIADMFLDKGTILTQRDRNGREQIFSAKSGTTTTLPVVIILNRFSASASEVLSAALHDNGRATIVGEKSFGKATVNIARELPDGGAVFVSIAQWLTPNGTLIDKAGINPDIEVVATDTDIDQRKDPQLYKAVDILEGQIRASAAP
jgi:carboxyl-terminal processing protease